MDGQQHDRFARLLAVTRTRRGGSRFRVEGDRRVVDSRVAMIDTRWRFVAPSLDQEAGGGLTSEIDSQCKNEVAHGRFQTRRAGTLSDE